MKSIPVLCAALGVLFATPAFADSVAEIMESINQEKIAKLTAYLEANPEAPDREEALDQLTGTYFETSDFESAQGVLEEKWASAPKGADADAQVLFQGTIAPLVSAYQQTGNKEKANAFLDDVEKQMAAHPMAPQISQVLDQMRGGLTKPSVGDTLDIAFIAVDGHEVNLSDMKGKVVLVDFWATWCGPCVAELPNVLAAYNDYHDQGFEIIGISLDDDKAKLEQFVKTRKMPWPQYFDGKGWENDLAQKYGIDSIPATFLVGPDGKVAATDLRGDALGKAVAGLLSKGSE